MDEVGGALIAIALVLCAVFIPAAFIGGIQGQFYRQFAVTIAAATVISAFVSLTLSPALCAILLKPHATRASAKRLAARCGRSTAFFDGFNRAFRPPVARLWRADAAASSASAALVLVVYAGLIALTGWQFARAPDRLHPRSRTRATSSPSSSCRPAPRWRAPTRWCGEATKLILGHGRRRARRAVRRLRRRHVHQRLQRRRHLLRLRAVRGARREGPDGRRHIQARAEPASSSAIQEAFILIIQPPPGARHRHRRRLQDDGRGPRRPRPAGARGGDAGDRRRAPTRRPASPASSRSSTPARRRSMPTSTA